MAIFSLGSLAQSGLNAGETQGPDCLLAGSSVTAADGKGLRIDTVFGAASRGIGVYDASGEPYYGYSNEAWASFARTVSNGSAQFSFTNLTPGSYYEIKLTAQVPNEGRHTLFTLPSGSYEYRIPASPTLNPPAAPVTTTEVADVNGEISVGVAKTADGSSYGHTNIAEINEVAAPIQNTRKGSTLTVDKTLGTITTATLNGVNVFDHLTAQDATTATFAGAVTDEITTSGEYSLVLGDGTVTETITLQVNVVGVAPSNNPLQKDGSALASLTGVQVRVTAGANLDGAQLEYLPTATTDASGNLSNIDLSSTAAADADPVLLHMRTAAGDNIIASETVGLI